MAAKSTAKKAPATKEEVLEAAIGDIRTKYGTGAIMRLGETVKDHIDVISTGILPLDVALGIGGLPRGRIVELFGPEGSGKTTVSLYAIAEAQKAGGVAAFIDAEHALDPRLAATVGVNIEQLYLSQPDSGEQALFILETLVRSSAVDIVVIDSVAALTPKAEIDGTIAIGESQVGLQARLMSYALRRLTSIIARGNCVVIFINQLRASIASSYAGSGPTETTTGGRALKFYSSVRIEVRRAERVMKGDTNIGHELKIKVVKNKQAPPFRSAHTTLIYGKGIPKGIAVLDMAIDYKVITKKGSWISYKGENLGQGKETVAQYLEANPDLMEELKKEVLSVVGEGLFVTPADASEPDAEPDEPVEEIVLDDPAPVLELDEES